MATTATLEQDIVLTERAHPVTIQSRPANTSQANALPPTDTGYHAWRLLLAAFMFESLLWGFPLTFGVFQNYYSRLPQFTHNPYLGVIGSIASGISYLAAPIIIPFLRRHARWRKRMIYIGWPVCLLGLVCGSYASTLGSLILTQGVMYGLGFVVFYYPILSYVNEWWVRRRGMAYGILCAASGVSGAVFPFAVEALLGQFGHQTTLRVIAVGLAVVTGPLIPLLKGRTPDVEAPVAARTDWSFVQSSLFWIYSTSNFAMGLGYFFPTLYLSSYATANGYSQTQGALLLALMSVAQVLGQFSFGYLSDKKSTISILAVCSTVVAALVVYAGWGLAHTLPALAVFTMLYGFFGAGYTALWGRMGLEMTSEPSAAFAAFGLLNFGKGLGNVLAGPLGGALLTAGINEHRYGTEKYERVVLFTGTCMAVSAVAILPSLCTQRKG